MWCRRLAILASISLALPGCAVGTCGTLIARYTRTPSAVVVDVYSAGVHLQPLGPDAGVSAGYRRASYVFSAGGHEPAPVATTWRWFRAPLPGAAPLLKATTVLGLQAQATPEIVRLGLGYIDQILTVGPGPGESRLVEILYDRSDPARAHVRSEETTHALSSRH
jgi:hypothetical protein